MEPLASRMKTISVRKSSCGLACSGAPSPAGRAPAAVRLPSSARPLPVVFVPFLNSIRFMVSSSVSDPSDTLKATGAGAAEGKPPGDIRPLAAAGAAGLTHLS